METKKEKHRNREKKAQGGVYPAAPSNTRPDSPMGRG